MTTPANFFQLRRAMADSRGDSPRFDPSAETCSLLARSLGQDSLRGGAEERRALEALWGVVSLRQLDALEGESDPALYYEALSSLAARLTREDRLDAAQMSYAFLAERANSASPLVASRSRSELDAILGRGAFASRFEFLARRFAREASSPSMLVGMTAASAIFQVSRAAFLARLTASPGLGMLSRGFGARAAAGLGAFALEAPTFTVAARMTRRLLGETSEISTPLGHEILGSYLTLGGLKLFGGLGQLAVRQAEAGTWSRILIPQISTYFGIVAGHRLEQLAGLRPSLSGDTLWADSLVTLLQFHVGGRLAHELGGPRLAQWQRGLELRSESLATQASPRNAGFPPLGGMLWGNPEFASGRPAFETGAEALLGPRILMMEGSGDGESPRANHSSVRGNGRASSQKVGTKNAYEILQELVRCRDRMHRRGQDELSLWQLMRRKLDEGAIPVEMAEEMQWAVYSRSLFENSAILQREFATQASSNFELTAFRLHGLRDEVAKEQGQPSYSLSTLVQALAFSGKIPFEKMRNYVSAASGLDFFLQTPALQRIGEEHFSSPYLLIAQLRRIMSDVETQRDRSYRLSTLMGALRWHPAFPRTQQQTYTMAAAASDFVRGHDLVKLRLDPQSLRSLDLEQVFLRLLHLKAIFRGESGEPVSIGYVLTGLRTEGLERIKGGPVNDTMVTHAHVLDFTFNRWAEWSGHYRNLAEIPKNGEGVGSRAGWTRPRYAKQFLLKEDGRPYSYSYAGNLVRWGEFLWLHREALELPEPGRVEVQPLATSRRSRLFAFLEPHWESLKEKSSVPEDFFETLLGLRREFFQDSEERSAASRGEPGEGPSLRMMVSAFYKSKGKAAPRSLEVYAAQVDTILQNWGEWRRYLRQISEVSENGHKGSRERYRIAAENFQQSNGEAYSKTLLSGLIRWGTWVYRHHRHLGLRPGESTLPPPSGKGEGPRDSGE